MKKPLMRTAALTLVVLGVVAGAKMGDSGQQSKTYVAAKTPKNLIEKQELKELANQAQPEEASLYQVEPDVSELQLPTERVILSARRSKVSRTVKVENKTQAALPAKSLPAVDIQAKKEKPQETPLELEVEVVEEALVVEAAPLPESTQAPKEGKVFTATAYDLSVDSCGKKPSHPQYGMTRSGYSLKGMSRAQAMTIAADPKVIPLGTVVYITFSSPYEHFNGNYTVRDTGGAIKGNKVDIFMGDFNKVKADQSVWDFGRREVKISY